jgi:hypothetical protein
MGAWNMPFYLRFGVGPLRFSERVGRTQAQKRAAARHRAQAKGLRQERRRANAWRRDYDSPARVAERQASAAWQQARRASWEARTYRAVVSECGIDSLAGGSFQVTAPGRPTIDIAVPPALALNFLSLRHGDVVQVTPTENGMGVETFYHLARASGAKPRNAANFPEGFQTRVTWGQERS